MYETMGRTRMTPTSSWYTGYTNWIGQTQNLALNTVIVALRTFEKITRNCNKKRNFSDVFPLFPRSAFPRFTVYCSSSNTIINNIILFHTHNTIFHVNMNLYSYFRKIILHSDYECSFCNTPDTLLRFVVQHYI